MSTKLETYIKMHKAELSTLTPPDNLWLSIESSIGKPAVIASKVSWLKYFGFSASAIAVVISVGILNKRSATEPEALNSSAKPAVVISSPEFAPRLTENKNGQDILPLISEKRDTPVVEAEAPAVPAVAPTPPTAPVAPVTPIAPLAPITGVPPVPAPRKPAPLSGNVTEYRVKETGGLKVDTSFSVFKRVELNVSSGDVFIQPSVLEKIFFKADISTESKGIVLGGKEEYEVVYSMNDSVLRITVQNNCKKRVVAGSYNESSMISLDLPDNVSLSVKSSYGNVIVKGLKGGRYEFETSSGDLLINDITSDLSVRSGYGYVSAVNTKGNIRMNVNSGDVNIDRLQGNAEISSAYGNQVYKDIAGDLKIKSVSGDVQVQSMKGNTEIHSNYGNISLNAFEGIPSLEAVSGDISGKQVMLKGNMTAKSSYGNIRMALLNEAKDLSFDLQTSYGKINVNKDGTKAEDDASVKIKLGDILITGITTSGNQSYK